MPGNFSFRNEGVATANQIELPFYSVFYITNMIMEICAYKLELGNEIANLVHILKKVKNKSLKRHLFHLFLVCILQCNVFFSTLKTYIFMKHYLFLSALSVMLIISSCEEQQVMLDQPVELQDQLSKKDVAKPLNYRTHMTGDQEVPPRDTKGQGQTIFQLSKDGTELSYKLIVANIENVTQAHIHLEAAGANGPVVVWLYPSAPPATLIPGRFNGVLAEGVITEADFRGILSGASMADLIDHFNNDFAYVNVHTSQFPPGEIRGQIWGNQK
jgi:hypothetical protein